MARLKQPFFSLAALGRMGKHLVTTHRHRAHHVQTRGHPEAGVTLAQYTWRTMFQKATALWYLQSAAEKAVWERVGTARHMTGYAWFMSQALKPNPGIYLPLAGGTMEGEIDMDDNQIGGLVDPTTPDKAARKAYVDAQVAGASYDLGARVYRNVGQTIDNGVTTAISFTTARWDTDSCFDFPANPTKLYARTRGKYVITGHSRFASNPTGRRHHQLTINGTQVIAADEWDTNEALVTSNSIASIWWMDPGNYVELHVYQNSGGPLDIQYTARLSPELALQCVGK